MSRRFLAAIATLVLVSRVAASEPNNTFATATILAPGQLSISDSLAAGMMNRPDTLLGIRDSSKKIYATDDDNSPIGNGTASGKKSVATNIGAIDFVVTGTGDEAFNGLHGEVGSYEVFVDIFRPPGVIIESFSEVRALQPGAVHEYLFSKPQWINADYDVYIDNTIQAPIAADVDYFTFTGLAAGSPFTIQTIGLGGNSIDTFLGWFHESGALKKTDDNSGVGLLSLIAGTVSPGGTLTFAVTGKGDNEFVGKHATQGGYGLSLVLEPPAILPDYNDNGVVDAADYVVWRRALGATGVNLVADGNRDNRVDAADYETWRAEFGRTSLMSHSASMVPEPGPPPLLAMLAIILALSGGRQPNSRRQTWQRPIHASFTALLSRSRPLFVRSCSRVGLLRTRLASRGFTIVELLVVITIFAILLALLLPAVQAARESGRRAQCQSNLKQISLGLLTFHDVHASFPPGGWGHEWVGIPDRGNGKQQPGGWIYCLLPYLEESHLHDLGMGFSGTGAQDAYTKRITTPLPILVCVSRRNCAAWPVAEQYPHVSAPKPYGTVTMVARADYAINGGSSHVFGHAGPVDLQQGDDELYWQKAPSLRKFTGVSHLRTAASTKSILDGTAKTYLVGEKYLLAADYETGRSMGDNESMYAGYCTDLHRFSGAVERLATSLPPYIVPLGDDHLATDGFADWTRFGSAHPHGLNLSRCDGSVNFVGYDVDPEVHFRSGHRSDEGKPLESLR